MATSQPGLKNSTQDGVLIRLTPKHIDVVSLSAAGDRTTMAKGQSTPNELASRIRNWIDERRIDRTNVVVSLSSETTHLVAIDAKDLEADPTRQAIAFHLESILPLDAEAIELDFLQPKETIVCLAVDVAAVMPWIDALENEGVEIRHIVSELMVVAQSLAGDHTFADDSTWVLRNTIDGQAWADCVRIHDGMAVAWSRLPDDADEIHRELQIQSMTQDSQASIIEAVAHDQSPILQSIGETHVINFDWDQQLATATSVVLSGHAKQFFDLRRGRLASHDPIRSIRSDLNRFFVAAMVGIVLICGAFWWKAFQYDRMNSQADQLMRNAYQQAIPGQRVPAALVRRIKSEHQRALGLRSGLSKVRVPIDVLDVLSALNQGLPKDIDVSIENLRINDGEFLLDLRIDSYQQGAQWVETIQATGFEVSPPAITRAGNGVLDAQLRGTWTGGNDAIPSR